MDPFVLLRQDSAMMKGSAWRYMPENSSWLLGGYIGGLILWHSCVARYPLLVEMEHEISKRPESLA
jgi:hypothetical protein